MLPTPDTSHIPTNLVYEPSEDSYLLLDTLSSDSERAFLRGRFPASLSASSSSENDNSPGESATQRGRGAKASTTPTPTPTPLALELGTGSGIVTAFLAAHASHIIGRRDVLVAATDLNPHACKAAGETIRRSISKETSSPSSADAVDEKGVATFLGIYQGDLASPLRNEQVDILIFNPPYVPTEELPAAAPPLPRAVPDSSTIATTEITGMTGDSGKAPFEEEEYYLSLAYAGGAQGMVITSRLIDSLPRILSPRGCAYVLLCRQNDPEGVKRTIRGLGDEWRVETVGSSGRTAGWEKLVVVRAWREGS